MDIPDVWSIHHCLWHNSSYGDLDPLAPYLKLALVLEHWSRVLLTTESTSGLPTHMTSTTDLSKGDLPIDWQQLHQLSEGDAEFELELLQMFVEDAHSHLELAKAAITANDMQQLKREAHHLKGTSANTGATTMSLTAEKLEQLARNQQLEGAASLVLELSAFLAQLTAAVAHL